MKLNQLSCIGLLCGLSLLASTLPAAADPPRKHHKNKGAKGVYIAPARPARGVVVKNPRRGAVVVKPRVPYVRYTGPRTRFVIRTGPWIGVTLLAAPYYYDYPAFDRYPVEVAVQIELQRQGYYRGPIDGDVGPGTSHAIAEYQRDNGLTSTGTINTALLRSLDIY